MPIFVQLLTTSPHENVREQVVWGLGNVVGDGAAHRDSVLAEGAVSPRMAQINEQSSLVMLPAQCRVGALRPLPRQAQGALPHGGAHAAAPGAPHHARQRRGGFDGRLRGALLRC